MEDKDLEITVNKAIDHLYEFYKCDHSFRMCVWLRPSENYFEKPEDLLSREQFLETIDSKYEFALSVLIHYIQINNKK